MRHIEPALLRGDRGIKRQDQPLIELMERLEPAVGRCWVDMAVDVHAEHPVLDRRHRVNQLPLVIPEIPLPDSADLHVMDALYPGSCRQVRIDASVKLLYALQHVA